MRDRGAGLRPRRGARRPARRPRSRSSAGWSGTAARPTSPRRGDGTEVAADDAGDARRDRRGTDAAQPSEPTTRERVAGCASCSSTTTGCSAAGVRAELATTRIEVVGEAADVPSAVAVVHAQRPTSSCSTCTCPAASSDGGARCSQRCADLLAASRRCGSWRCRCPTRPRTSSPSSGPARAGYVTKTISGAELADAVHRVADGDAVFSPAARRVRARRVRDRRGEVAERRRGARPAHRSASAR